jgi:HPt (histidine-containing phosphotransfer) domain-containing protein
VSRDLLESVSRTFGEANPAFLAELVMLFLDAAPETLTALEDALRAGDPVRAARSAHALKGAALQMGARRLADLCGSLEDGVATASGSGEILGQVKAEFENVRRELRGLSGAPPPGRG